MTSASHGAGIVGLVVGIVAIIFLAAATFTGNWLRIYTEIERVNVYDEHVNVNVVFGLFRYCVNGRCIDFPPAQVGSTLLVWRACAFGSWIAIGIAMICSGVYMCTNERKHLLKVAIFLCASSLIAILVVIGVFAGSVDDGLSRMYQYTELHVVYSWSFYLFIAGSVFAVMTIIAVCIMAAKAVPDVGEGGVVMSPVNSYPPGPYTPGQYLGGPSTQFQPGPGGPMYAYDQPPAYYPGAMSGLPSMDLTLDKLAAPPTVHAARNIDGKRPDKIPIPIV